MIFREAKEQDISQLVQMRIAYIREDFVTLTEKQIVEMNQVLPCTV